MSDEYIKFKNKVFTPKELEILNSAYNILINRSVSYYIKNEKMMIRKMKND